MHILGKRVGCSIFNYQMAIGQVTGDVSDRRGGVGFGSPQGDVGTPMRLPLNTWKYLAGTFDGSTFRFYVDGALVGTGNGTLDTPNSEPLKIGHSGNCSLSSLWQGFIDEVRIYNRALSDEEIEAIYDSVIGR